MPTYETEPRLILSGNGSSNKLKVRGFSYKSDPNVPWTTLIIDDDFDRLPSSGMQAAKAMHQCLTKFHQQVEFHMLGRDEKDGKGSSIIMRTRFRVFAELMEDLDAHAALLEKQTSLVEIDSAESSTKQTLRDKVDVSLSDVRAAQCRRKRSWVR